MCRIIGRAGEWKDTTTTTEDWRKKESSSFAFACYSFLFVLFCCFRCIYIIHVIVPVYSVHPFVFPSTSIDSGNFCFYYLLGSAWCCARLWARVQSGEPRDSCLPPPSLVRSFFFFVCFRLPMTEELNASQFLVSIHPRRWCFFGLGFGVFYCAWQWHARPDFFVSSSATGSWQAQRAPISLSLCPLLIVLFVNVSSFGTIRRSYPLARINNVIIQSRRM